MNWLSPENVIAIVSTLLGVLATFGTLWYERRVPRSKRIGYRVQMDTAIGDSNRSGATNPRLGLFNESPGMADATLALVRIENDGSRSISVSDYSSPDGHGHGLIAKFTGRTVRAVAVTQPSDSEHLREHLTPARGLRYEGDVLHVPKVPLNPGEYFKLLVLLSGGPVDSPVEVTGGVHDGRVVRNRARPPDEKLPLFSPPAQLLAGLLTLCVFALSTFTLLRDDTPPPIGCVAGGMRIVGSTAFKPTAEELATNYDHVCPGEQTIAVDTLSSDTGVRELETAGEEAEAAHQGSPPVIAFSDGPAQDGSQELVPQRIAVSVFALVVNNRVKLRNLSVPDVRRLYSGRIRNWQQLGGPDLPVVLVSRQDGSGTRGALQRHVLGGAFETNTSSTDGCATRADPKAKVIRCELDSTDLVLAKVRDIPGAIGYSELRKSDNLEGEHRLKLGGHEPTTEHIATSGYPYYEIEYAYTYGNPPTNSLSAAFLSYVGGLGQEIIRNHGQVPCSDGTVAKICNRP